MQKLILLQGIRMRCACSCSRYPSSPCLCLEVWLHAVKRPNNIILPVDLWYHFKAVFSRQGDRGFRTWCTIFFIFWLLQMKLKSNYCKFVRSALNHNRRQNYLRHLRKKDNSWAWFYLFFFKKVWNTFQWSPLPTPPIQCCTAGLKVCGHSETTQHCQGGRGGGTLSQGSSKHLFLGKCLNNFVADCSFQVKNHVSVTFTKENYFFMQQTVNKGTNLMLWSNKKEYQVPWFVTYIIVCTGAKKVSFTAYHSGKL